MEVHLGKGYKALKQDRYSDAAQEFPIALKIDATLTMRARFPLAVALFEEDKPTEARRELETVRRAYTGGIWLGRKDSNLHRPH